MRLQSDLKVNLKLAEPLAKHTSFKIGGSAQFYAKPANLSELLYLLRFQEKESTPLHILGGGCNTLFSDKGFPGLVLDMSGFEKNGIRIEGNRVKVSAGSPLHAFAMRLKEEGLAGLEFLAHLPGTVGGALAMNAGFGKDVNGERQEVSRCLVEATVLSPKGNLERLRKEDVSFGYRFSSLKGSLILEAVFEMTPRHPSEIQKIMDENVSYRRRVQDWAHPSAGSVFKNPIGFDWTVGEMVERLGVKGTQIGGAQISQIHGNFFINKGGAKAQDVCALMDLVRSKVHQEFGVHLESEIQYVQG